MGHHVRRPLWLLTALLAAFVGTLTVAALTQDPHDQINERLDRIDQRLAQTPAPSEDPIPHVSPSAASRSRTAPQGRLLSVTCYTATGHRTASGLWPREGMAASNAYPFGTKLMVEKVGVVVVQDRIGWGSDLDLYRDSRASCVTFGRRSLHVAVAR